MMRLILLLAAMLLGSLVFLESHALAQSAQPSTSTPPATAPLPPPRPNDIAPPMPTPAADKPAPAADKPSEPAQAQAVPETCLARLKRAGFDIDAAAQPSGPDAQCRIEEPVQIKGVPARHRAGAMLRLVEEPILACGFAEVFGSWLGELVAPQISASLDADLARVRTGPGFVCRNRGNSEKLSAHALGIAIDISGFELSNGSRLTIGSPGKAAEDQVLATIRTAGCGWFTTVLGPGSDAAHADHLHVDVQQHGSSDRYRICQ